MRRGRSASVVHLELHTGDLGEASAFHAELCGWRPARVLTTAGSYQALDLGRELGGGIVQCPTERALWLPIWPSSIRRMRSVALPYDATMSGAELGLATAVFLACAVEAVEALTIVLAVGTTRSWSSALSGVGAATVALALIVATLGPALTALPIGALRLAVGGLLLIFGLQWLRKAILRASGLKALRDEQEEFAEQRRVAQAVSRGATGLDGYSFAISFKGVLLEGLEVVFIVLTFGANQHRVGLAAAAAGLAVALVVAAGVAVRAPLARVPENTMKFAVGVMLSSFGTFWGTQGAGASWPGSDAALLVLIPTLALASLAMVAFLRRNAATLAAEVSGAYVPGDVSAPTEPVVAAERL
jgi:uncharacterized membrane protein